MVVKAKITAAEKRGGGGRGRAVVEEETMCNNNNSSGGGGGLMRKGPWTEQEDAQLVWFVRLLGERRWDFLAKVSGLKRTGKSCRLRWVNYLHPGLKRGRITPDEEILIRQLYAQWGSRWSRIARKLPGRTDNEIKNYWRTHTRKKAQEEKKKRAAAPASSSSSSSSSMSTRTTTSCSASLNNGTTATSSISAVTTEAPQESTSGDEAEEATTAASQHQHHQQPQPQEQEHYYSMDQLWNEIAAAEAAATSYAEGWGSAGHVVAAEPAASMPSPVWEFCADYSLWRIDDEEYYKRCSMLHDAYHLSS